MKLYHLNMLACRKLKGDNEARLLAPRQHVCLHFPSPFRKFHPSTIICPITINVKSDAEILRVHLSKGLARLKEDCDIMIDQIRTIDNKRLLKKIGDLNQEQTALIKTNLNIIPDL